jgi:pSer/pThr/pTyr-binding forkhead associated (FHA) protein
MLEFTEGSWLEYWYDWYLAVPALLVSAYLTLRSTFSMPWINRNALIARVLTLLGTALVAIVVLDIFEIETVPLDTFDDDDLYGYLSVGGAAAATLVSLIGMLAYRGGRGRRPKKKKEEDQVEETPSAEDELMADLADIADSGSPTDTMVLNTVGGPTAWLVVRSGGEPGSIIELAGEGMIVGRDSASEVHLDHPSVSGSHALFREYRGTYTLADLGSSNGTRINGDLEAGAVLKDGSKISIGATELHYSLVAAEAEAEDGIESAEAPAAQTGILLVKSGPEMGKSFKVEQGDMIIGRQAGYGGVNIDDPAISALHAMLRQMPRGARLYDLGSVNGTSVDDVAISGVELKHGDVLKFGEAEVQFVKGESA